jgi:predicted metalloprotease
MKWTGLRRSGNIEDRRGGGGFGRGFGGGALGGGGGGLPRVPLTGGGIVVLLLVVAITVFAGDPLNLLGGSSRGLTGSPDPSQAAAADMTSVILASTEDVWRDVLAKRGVTYQEPTLVLFDYQVDSGCGYASSVVGPFYCPRDRTAYLDLTFFDELSQRFGAPGDFAQAYVVAHEIGHHVQNLLGVSDDVSEAQQRLSEGQANALSVRLELQADFYAGVWAHHAHERNQLLEPGDLEEALGAATAIGDDRLQREAQGRVVPDSFTHGTSEQRVAWFRKGFESGRLEDGDTFAARDLARP